MRPQRGGGELRSAFFASILDELRPDSVRSRLAIGGPAIPHVNPASVRRTGTGDDVAASAPGGVGRASAGSEWGWDRLERAVTRLAEEVQSLRESLRGARGELADRDQRIRRLEAQLLDANQRRQDTGKRIDELISQLDQLDVQLASVEPSE